MTTKVKTPPSKPTSGVPKAPAGLWFFVTDRGARQQLVPEIRHEPGDWFEPRFWNALSDRQRNVLVSGRYLQQKYITE